ncbi:MAG: hypothetical protein ABIN67_06400 [Ferruginibacter sp.]
MKSRQLSLFSLRIQLKGINFFVGLTLIFISLLSPKISISQVVNGCTDPLANNYNAAANVNDGTCAYNNTSYTPPVKVSPLSDTLVESSGLQMAGNYLWSFNDGGGAAAIYRIDTVTKNILQTVNLANATNVDWEDIAFDGASFYIGDIGNNANGARTNLTIYKFPFAAIPDYIANPVVTIPAASIGIIHFTYSDQPQPPVPVANNFTKFDCEAMIADSGKIHLFTKDWINLTTTHYVVDDTPGTYIAVPVETLATNYLVTGADKAPGQNLVVLLGYQNSGTANHFMHLLSGYSAGKYFNGNKRWLDLPDVFTMGQAEGITFRNGVYGYISNEKFVRYFGSIPIIITQKLRSFNISSFVSSPAGIYRFTGNGNWDEATNWNNNEAPPSPLSPGSEIVIDPVSGGKCVLNIPYTVLAGGTLTVMSGKEFEVTGNLTISQ